MHPDAHRRARSARASLARASLARASVALLATLALALPGAPAAGAAGRHGFLTSQPAMLTGLAPGSSVRPILSVGDTLRNGYRYEAVPDGIALMPSPEGLAAFVNHETSTVPFPYVSTGPTADNSFNDFDNAQVSELTLDPATAGVLGGRIVIPSSANYQRFCSNFLVGPSMGFERPLLLTNEETSDFVNRSGTAWPPATGSEQAGVVVAYDTVNHDHRSIYGLGRMNHENTVAIPGYGHPVLLTGDDTFSAPSSQLYLYQALSGDHVWHDRGSLWAFVSDNPAVNDYGDLSAALSVSGHFIPVPRAIAKGDQTGLQTWSNDNNVFQFIRVEDIAFNRTTPNVVYVADTGEPRAIPDAASGRLIRGPSGTTGPYPNGRIFKVVLDPADPTVVTSLSILIDGDVGGYNNPLSMHQPDNLETTATSLLIQEDPGSHNNYAADDPNGTTARIWRYDLTNGAFTPVARVDQSADPAASQGNWESSGIVDASAAYGPGAFLVNVQAHSLWIETAPGPDLVAPAGPDWTYKREGGQLVLLRIPGA